jgi:mRNA interferase RelE/StbE
VAYQIVMDPAAVRELKKLDARLRQEIADVITALADDPRPPSAKKLQGSKSSYRVRIGDHRLLYKITDATLTVLVVRIRHRRDAYRE